jgi:hypothetical protein
VIEIKALMQNTKADSFLRLERAAVFMHVVAPPNPAQRPTLPAIDSARVIPPNESIWCGGRHFRFAYAG